MATVPDLDVKATSGAQDAPSAPDPAAAGPRGAAGAVDPSPARAAWTRAPVQAAAAVAIGIVALHAATAASIVAIWMRSETFAHGFVVLPICLWLVWRQRRSLADVVARPWWPGVLLVLAAGAMWFVTSLADVLGLKQFALAFMVQAAIVTVVGLQVARVVAFPLAFLLFAIPVGEIFVPTLIEWTADFTVMALRASGVPVYREANHFVIPSGQWSVVEACSGIRYLIASVMVGTIYAAVAYRSTRRRAWFMAAAIATPLAANWLRAYMIVMLGHLSNNKIAVGVDHIIYGWIFFGVVMLLLFWIGSFWREDAVPAPAVPRGRAALPAGAGPATPVAGTAFFASALACLVAAGIWLPLEAAVSAAPAQAPSVAAWPARNGWEAGNREFADWTPHYRGFAWDARQSYTKDGREAALYVAYYRGQTKGRELVTSGNRLVTMENARWKQLARLDDSVQWNGADVAAPRAVIAGPDVTLDAIRLFWVDGEVTASEYAAKALTAWAKLRGRGDDSALIVFYAPRRAGEADASATLRAFARDMSPAVARALDAVRTPAR